MKVPVNVLGSIAILTKNSLKENLWFSRIRPYTAIPATVWNKKPHTPKLVHSSSFPMA